jgi:hypothetical protein
MFIDETYRTIAWGEGRDLPSVFDQLHAATFSYRGVRLLGFDAHLFKHDPLALR